ASFAIGHPEKVVDFAYRAVHEMAVKSKAIIAAFYDCAPRFSYWTGCSTGGRQALMEAQRYPDDFDGIIAGAPANNQTQLCAWRIAVEARTLQDPASVVPVAKLALVNRAVLAACDALDGVTDRLLTDPHQCHFDPATILCRGVDRDDCLTARQVEAVKMGYAPATRRTGELIYPGLVPGGEMGWAMLTGAKPEPGGIDVGMFRFVAHEDPAWDWRTFDQDVRPWYHVGRPGRGFCPDGRQTLPWDYFRVARHQGTSPQITDERWTYDKKCGVSLSYVPFPRSLLPFGLVKEGEQLGIDLVFQGRAHAVRPAGNDLELGAFSQAWRKVAPNQSHNIHRRSGTKAANWRSSTLAAPLCQLSAIDADIGSGKMSSSPFSTPSRMARATDSGDAFDMSRSRVISVST